MTVFCKEFRKGWRNLRAEGRRNRDSRNLRRYFGTGARRNERSRDSRRRWEDLIVQTEIFIQYSLHAKAQDDCRDRVAIPGEEEKNARLRNLYETANGGRKEAKKAKPLAPGGATRVEPSHSDGSFGEDGRLFRRHDAGT